MLTVLYGPSCVGKTTLIARLRKDYSWKPISCYLTRTVRSSDIGRIEVTTDEFKKLKDEGFFHCVNHHFQTSYGTPKDELIQAGNCRKDKYILDFMLKNYQQLEQFDHNKIIVLPESLEKFKLQIEKSGRSDRKKEIIRDLQDNYNPEQIMIYKKKGFQTIVSRYNNIDATLSDFFRIV